MFDPNDPFRNPPSQRGRPVSTKMGSLELGVDRVDEIIGGSIKTAKREAPKVIKTLVPGKIYTDEFLEDIFNLRLEHGLRAVLYKVGEWEVVPKTLGMIKFLGVKSFDVENDTAMKPTPEKRTNTVKVPEIILNKPLGTSEERVANLINQDFETAMSKGKDKWLAGLSKKDFVSAKGQIPRMYEKLGVDNWEDFVLKVTKNRPKGINFGTEGTEIS